jgi:hypothetical protein
MGTAPYRPRRLTLRGLRMGALEFQEKHHQKGSHLESAFSSEALPPAFVSTLTKVKTNVLIKCSIRLKNELERPENPEYQSTGKQLRLVQTCAEVKRNLRKRAEAGDHEALSFLMLPVLDRLKTLADADLPALPSNLDQISNGNLDDLISEVERRIACFSELYWQLDRKLSQLVRDRLESDRRLLQKQRADRRPSPLPRKVDNGPSVLQKGSAEQETKSEVTRAAAAEITEPILSEEIKRRQTIDAFIAKMKQAGRRVTRKDIYTVSGYGDRTEFQRFQRADMRTTASSIANFMRVLQMEPQEFLRALDLKQERK